jgi:hypothetical protein
MPIKDRYTRKDTSGATATRIFIEPNTFAHPPQHAAFIVDKIQGLL